MASSIWWPWEQKPSVPRKRGELISEEMQQAILNVHEFLVSKFPKKYEKLGAITASGKALKIHRNSVAAIVKRCTVKTDRRIGNSSRPTNTKFKDIDNKWKTVVRQIIYGFKIAPTLDAVYQKLLEDSNTSQRYIWQ